jgi:hypothetical protein
MAALKVVIAIAKVRTKRLLLLTGRHCAIVSAFRTDL